MTSVTICRKQSHVRALITLARLRCLQCQSQGWFSSPEARHARAHGPHLLSPNYDLNTSVVKRILNFSTIFYGYSADSRVFRMYYWH